MTPPTLNPSDYPKEAEDFIVCYNITNERGLMDADSLAAADAAIKTLKERGMPEKGTYSLSEITATDEEDLNLKIHLVVSTPARDLLDGKITEEEFIQKINPIMEVAVNAAMKAAFTGEKYPLTIKANEDV